MKSSTGILENKREQEPPAAPLDGNGSRSLAREVYAFHKERDFRGKDVSDVLTSKVYSYFLPRSTRSFPAKVVYFFLDKLNRSFGHRIREVFRLDSSYQYPQAHALIVRGLVKLYETKPSKGGEAEIRELADALFAMRSTSGNNHGWGQPFDWPSNKVMKAGTPRATVSSQVAMAFLDIYEVFGDAEFLDIAEGTCRLFIEDFNYTPDADGDFCFSYTTADNYHIHNASTLAASVLIRVYYHTRKEGYLQAGAKALRFTAKDQKEDGAWNYRAKPDKVKGMVDNIHTGFVLESFLDSKKYWVGDDFPFERELELGMNYYIQNFIAERHEPKYRPDRIYPVDIQSCAQVLLTLILHDRHTEKHDADKRLINGVLNYTLENLYNGNGQFYYRVYSDRIDKNSFIRWGDAWMIRVLGEYTYSKSNDQEH